MTAHNDTANGEPPPCAEDCAAVVRDGFRDLGAAVNVSWLPPIVDSGYEDLAMHCPHGVRWYAEPTSEQRAEWAKAGVL